MRAVTHDKGPAMVIAGPGSGKTTVITQRIRFLINDLGVSSQNILVITFTKAAAEEMKERAAKLTDSARGVAFGTFHSVFYGILKKSCPDTGSIIGDRDKRRILQNIVRSYLYSVSAGSTLISVPQDSNTANSGKAVITAGICGDAGSCTAADSRSDAGIRAAGDRSICGIRAAGASRAEPADTAAAGIACREVDEAELSDRCAYLSGDISAYKTRLDLAEDFMPRSMDTDSFLKAYREYGEELKCEGKLDFDDIVLKTHRLLLRDARVRTYWQKRFGYILIDEFQDIDPLQYACVKLLLSKEENLFVVGDDDQSIYGFRGAGAGIMLGLDRDFPGIKKIVLDRNFRCPENIGTAALRLIAHNKNRFEKEISFDSSREGELEVKVFKDREEESVYVAGKLAGGNGGTKAVLVRTYAGAKRLSQLLSDRGKGFEMKGNSLGLHDHFVAGDMTSYIRLALGTGSRADLIRIMNRPDRGLTRRLLGEGTDIEAAAENLRRIGLDTKEVYLLKKRLEAVRDMAPFAALTYIWRVMGYGDFCREYAGQQGIGFSVLESVFAALKKEAAGYKSLEQWERNRRWRKEGGRPEGGSPSGRDGRTGVQGRSTSPPRGERGGGPEGSITITTLHAGKGLEFDEVYILDVNEGNIPCRRGLEVTDEEEERRLLYVGMTRAKRKLVLCSTQRVQGQRTSMSSFVAETGIVDENVQ